MIDLRTIFAILRPDTPEFPNLRPAASDKLYFDGLTMGTLIVGKQGSGKTTWLANQLMRYFKAHPKNAVFVLDWSGSITNTLFSLLSVQGREVRQRLDRRIIYDELGNSELIVPLPEFSTHYGITFEEQVQRVTNNFVRLSPNLVEHATILGERGLKGIAPHFFRLMTSIENKHGENWQITEVKKLIVDLRQLRLAVKRFGYKIPESKWYLENEYLSESVKARERELRTYALRSILDVIEPRETRARVGYYRPGWTPREAIKEGFIVIVNGEKLINQEATQHYLFTQVYSLIMAEINKRQPANSADMPVALVLDEVYSLLQIPGMAKEIGMISPIYRSRKLQLFIVIQALWQLEKTLREQIWSLGNVVSFGVQNFDESYTIAQQLFEYDPKTVKMKTDTGQTISEPDRGQYLTVANWIQGLKHRECIMRNYVSEQVQEKYIAHVWKTADIPEEEVNYTIDDMKYAFLKRRAVPVRDALEIINQRRLTIGSKEPPQI
jgi:hypothetical protein